MIQRIFLIGFRGTGKTTIGTLLAQNLGYQFSDTDELICRAHGSVEEIVKTRGWNAFRQFERDALNNSCSAANMVIATGGGAVLHTDFWIDLGDDSLVVWLYSDEKTTLSRLHKDGNSNGMRPSLTGKSIASETSRLLKKREPLYKRFSHERVSTVGKAIPEVEKELTEVCQRYISGWAEQSTSRSE